MLAIIYLGLAIYLGDQLCRRFFRFVSFAHRCAAAVLVGLLLSSWFTYVAAWMFRRASRPLLWADLCFLAAAIGAIWLFKRRARRGLAKPPEFIEPRPPGSARWDWITLGIYLVLACWMMFATLNYKDGNLLIGNNEWSDFGPNTAIMQSFAVGHNFPTHYPHFSGETIRYHFLFYFQAGNLTFLGLNLAWSLNLLSILSLVCMLALVMALGQLLFNSRAIGRIGSALFFFHGTLSFVPFLQSQTSVAGALRTIFHLKEFLPSGYPYRGELWGIWTQVVFLNQRHLASAIGIFLLVLLFLIDRYRQNGMPDQIKSVPPADEEPLPSPAPIAFYDSSPSTADREPEPLPQESPPFAESEPIVTQTPDAPPAGEVKPNVTFAARVINVAKDIGTSGRSFLFSGLLLGALPFWNAMVFTSAFAVLLCFFILFPCRKYMVALAITTAVAALPQILILRSGGVKTPTHSLLHWGYVIDQPTIAKVLNYLGFNFGVKWLLILVALIFVSWFHRRLFIALCSLFLLTFCFRLSIETLASHKFLNVWLIIGNLFVAYGLWRLWHIRLRGLAIAGRLVAIVLALAIVAGGIIDLFPIHNGYYMQIKYERDPLVEWVRTHTKPHDVFLSDRFVNHQILMAGRRLFYGWPSFPWSSGYDTTKRDQVYRQLFESRDPRLVFQLLKQNRIAYVAVDNGVRRGEFIKRANEDLYSRYCQKVFEDKANKYNSLTIYKVPDAVPVNFAPLPEAPPFTMFEGGKGKGRGQFDFPRGLTADNSGNILVSDTDNGRIQKFSRTGVFLAAIGESGAGAGALKAPDGIAVDKDGFIYVADAGNQSVQKLAPNGAVVTQWKGPDRGFYGPRDVAIGPDNSIYVVDQGHARIVRFASSGEVLHVWGSPGKGDGQFNEPSSIAVDGINNRVYVADPRNQRIQVFDLEGKFVTKWQVTEWQPNSWAFQRLLFDPKGGHLYASSLATDEVLVFDSSGTKIRSLKPKPPDKLGGASALALANGKLYVLNSFGNRVSQIDLPGQ